MKITENCTSVPNYATLEIRKTYENGVLTIRLAKYVEKGNFPMILCRITKNLLRRGHSTDLVQLNCLFDAKIATL